MYFKLSLRNFKRSIKDYFIYFFTLTFSVCLFYIFNSFSAQSQVMNLSEHLKEMFGVTDLLMTAFSFVVAFTLGFLIVYANNFLIKKRKKELGIYMTLGMPRRKISNIFILETLFIGIVSLGAGILIGIFLSQGITLVTASLLNVDIEKFKMVLSISAIIKTILCFGIIFICVIIFNNHSLSKHTLIDLINYERKNEKFKTKNIYVSFIIFLVSIVGISYTYYSFIITISDLKAVGLYTFIGIISVFLFFLSICGFLLKVAQRSKKRYFNNLNMFLLRQLNSKVNTNYVSLSLICILLTLTVSFISVGFGAKSAQEGSIEFNSPYDATCIARYIKGTNEKGIKEYLGEFNINIDEFSNKYINYTKYDSGIAFDEIVNSNNLHDKSIKSNIESLMGDFNIIAIGISDYNRLLEMQGEEEIKSIKDDEIILVTDQHILEKELNGYIEDNKTLEFNNKIFKISNSKVKVQNLSTSYAPDDFLTLVIPDKETKELKPSADVLSLEYRNNTEELNDEFESSIGNITEKYSWNIFKSSTKMFVGANSRSLSTVGVYVASYLGIIFLISSATILALQQLVEAEDNKQRFKTLKKIGVDSDMINKCLFKQTLIYFMTPLSLAILNSLVIIKFAEKSVLSILGVPNILNNILITSAITITIYGAYFLATYNSVKKSVN